MEIARAKIRQVLSKAKQPAVLTSFGKDSLLLMALAREVRKDVAALWLRNGTDESFAKEMIRYWNLTVFCWAPADVYLLTNGAEHVLVGEYSFGPDRLPLLTDIAEGTDCVFNAQQQRTPELSLPFDVILWGVKDSDSHWIKGDGKFKEDGFMLGRAQVFAPIRHMTDDQVRANMSELKIPYRLVRDEVPMCTACMTANTHKVFCPEVGRVIDRHQWEAEKSLAAFRQRFGLENNHG